MFVSAFKYTHVPDEQLYKYSLWSLSCQCKLIYLSGMQIIIIKSSATERAHLSLLCWKVILFIFIGNKIGCACINGQLCESSVENLLFFVIEHWTAACVCQVMLHNRVLVWVRTQMCAQMLVSEHEWQFYIKCAQTKTGKMFFCLLGFCSAETQILDCDFIFF